MIFHIGGKQAVGFTRQVAGVPVLQTLDNDIEVQNAFRVGFPQDGAVKKHPHGARAADHPCHELRHRGRNRPGQVSGQQVGNAPCGGKAERAGVRHADHSSGLDKVDGRG